MTTTSERDSVDCSLFHGEIFSPPFAQPKNIEHNLRQRTHNLTLPMDVNAAMKQNFVYRMLFSDIY